MSRYVRSVVAACLALAFAIGLVPLNANAQDMRRVPDGSYLNSCNNVSVRPDDRGPGLVLLGLCRNRYGSMNKSALPLPCRGNIANYDGQLTCEDRNNSGWRDGDRGDNRWRGGQIEIFVDAGFRGNSRVIGDSVVNLRDIGFNDKVSSIRVDSGRWQICVDAGFQGRCEIIDRSVGNLRDWGLNDAISSIRQVGR